MRQYWRPFWWHRYKTDCKSMDYSVFVLTIHTIGPLPYGGTEHARTAPASLGILMSPPPPPPMIRWTMIPPKEWPTSTAGARSLFKKYTISAAWSSVVGETSTLSPRPWTFSEQSVNNQWTIREQSMNNQWTISEQSVNNQSTIDKQSVNNQWTISEQ
jgi:hypothetical protein